MDLTVPDELHDKFNDYPVAPETCLFDASPTSESLRQLLELPKATVKKLIPHVYDKKQYVCCLENLRLYMDLGVVVTKVHRVLSYRQETYLAPYIKLNTEKRTATNSDFEKELYKLLNNSIFGKTCENVEKRIDVRIIHHPNQLVKQASKPSFKSFTIFNNDLVGVEMAKTEIKYDRPMIVGMVILELSKVLMYDFHYNVIQARYGSKAKLCFTDTDSLTYLIETPDIYADMLEMKEHFDTSDYPVDHPNYSLVNKKVIGKFKDELNGKPMWEFVGLRAKMYSILKEQAVQKDGKLDSGEKKTAKGVQKAAIKRLTHENYKAAVFSTDKEDLQRKVKFNTIRAYEHQVGTVAISKTGLCAYDDKKWVMEDNVHTLAHGHWRTRA